MTGLESQGAGHWVPPAVTPPLRMQVLNFTAFLGLALLVVLLAGIGNWYKFRRQSPRIRRTVWWLLLAVPFGVSAGLDLLSPMTGVTSSRLIADALLFLSWTLPDNLAATVLVVALPLIVLGWAIDKQFRESEFGGNLVQGLE